MSTLTIGRLASLGGVRVDTVRFYERKGLLPAPSRTEAGYRNYQPEHVDRLRFIRRAKELGFSLDQIAELLKVGAGEVSPSVIQTFAVQSVGDLDRKIHELSAIRDVLQAYVDRRASHGDLIRALLVPPSPLKVRKTPQTV